MKTKILNILMLLAAGLGFASCNDDTEPVLELLSNVEISSINAPGAVTLVESDNANVVFSLEWTEPKFSVQVPKTYRIEVSDSEDFARSSSVATTSSTRYDVTVAELNKAVRAFYETIIDCTPKDIFVRVRCELNSDASFGYASAASAPINVTPYEGEYPRLYVIGSIQGWNINSSNYYLVSYENNGIFTGELGIPAGGQFRFYTELGDWETNSYGSQATDAGIEITLPGGIYDGALVVGKGSWIFPADAEGTYNCTVDMNAMSVKFEYVGEYRDTAQGDDDEETETPTGLFVVGNINGWSLAPTATEGTLTETAEGSDVWSGTFSLPDSGDGYSYFRFYTELNGGDFNTGSIGTVSGENETLELTDGIAEATLLTDSQGCFVVSPGSYQITVDIANNTMLIEAAE